MKSFAEENGLLKKPSDSLICSYYDIKILIATPLLKWYLEKGLEITYIYEVSLTPSIRYFTSFGLAWSTTG